MKKYFITLCYLCFVYTSQVAVADEYPFDLYVGGDLLIANKTKLEINQITISESNDLGFNLYAGTNFLLAPKASVGLDLEYQHYGKADSEDGIKITGRGFFLNARPRFLGNQLYTEFLAGFGLITGEVRGRNFDGLSSDTEMAYQLGAGFGFKLTKLDINISYRHRFTELFTFDTSMSGLIVGVRYNMNKKVLFK